MLGGNLLAALTVKLHSSLKSKWPRVILTALAALLTLFAITTTYSLCMLYGQIGANPVSYYTNPDNGNRLVIMKAVDLEASDASGKQTYFYGAYPMRNKYLYYPERGGMISTRTGVDYVEWIDDGMGAQVHITDVDGVEQLLTVDFNAPTPAQASDAGNAAQDQ